MPIHSIEDVFTEKEISLPISLSTSLNFSHGIVHASPKYALTFSPTILVFHLTILPDVFEVAMECMDSYYSTAKHMYTFPVE
jgi:hypothetical protein